jgi:hypothetical protein
VYQFSSTVGPLLQDLFHRKQSTQKNQNTKQIQATKEKSRHFANTTTSYHQIISLEEQPSQDKEKQSK